MKAALSSTSNLTVPKLCRKLVRERKINSNKINIQIILNQSYACSPYHLKRAEQYKELLDMVNFIRIIM